MVHHGPWFKTTRLWCLSCSLSHQILPISPVVFLDPLKTQCFFFSLLFYNYYFTQYYLLFFPFLFYNNYSLFLILKTNVKVGQNNFIFFSVFFILIFLWGHINIVMFVNLLFHYPLFDFIVIRSIWFLSIIKLLLLHYQQWFWD
jgi:hypothetical protein